jgi:hypothetical protein
MVFQWVELVVELKVDRADIVRLLPLTQVILTQEMAERHPWQQVLLQGVLFLGVPLDAILAHLGALGKEEALFLTRMVGVLEAAEAGLAEELVLVQLAQPLCTQAAEALDLSQD